MNSQTTEQFWKLYFALPKEVRQRAAKAYRLWRTNPEAPSLFFKRVGKRHPVFSARISDDYRVLGLLEGNTITWFWIGKHDEYDRLLKGM